MDRLHILEQWIASNMSFHRVTQWLESNTLVNHTAIAGMKARMEEHRAHCARLENDFPWLVDIIQILDA